MKGLYCQAGASESNPKFVIQETVGFSVVFWCFTFKVDADSGLCGIASVKFAAYKACVIFLTNVTATEWYHVAEITFV